MAQPTQFRPDQVDASSFIAPGAVVVGDVTLEAHSSVWFTAVLRGDTAPIRVGKGSNVQDGSVLHADPGFPCTLGDGVTVGHRAIVHGATVGENSLIGMGAIVLTGAVIGKNCLIGAGALVTEGMQVPDGSVVLGLPGKIRRTLTDEEKQGNQRTAQVYIQRAQDYLAGMTSS